MNAQTFKATKKLLATLRKGEDLLNYFAVNEIEWKLNMARVPWWGGFFERLIGVMKRTLSKTIGKAFLKFDELREILLDVEISTNNRPLCYIAKEYEIPVITPNILLRGRPTWLLEENCENLNDDGREKMTRRLRYLQTYLHALQERFSKNLRLKEQGIPEQNSVVSVNA